VSVNLCCPPMGLPVFPTLAMMRGNLSVLTPHKPPAALLPIPPPGFPSLRARLVEGPISVLWLGSPHTTLFTRSEYPRGRVSPCPFFYPFDAFLPTSANPPAVLLLCSEAAPLRLFLELIQQSIRPPCEDPVYKAFFPTCLLSISLPPGGVLIIRHLFLL